MSYEVFRIPAERVTELEERVAKLNKKAAKLGTPPIDLIVTDKTEEVTVNVGGTMSLRMGTKFTYTVREVLLKGETPKLNGWEFLAVVLHRPAGNDFLNVADADADVSEYVFRDKVCDHCNKKRVRNATFLVRHEDGQVKQVGSTCLEDYTGVKSPQAHARQLENIFNLFKALRGWGMMPGRTTRKFFVTEWLAYVNMVVREKGRYVGRNRAEYSGEWTTAEVAKPRIIDAATNPNVPAPTDEDFKLAQEAVAWVRSDEGAESVLAFSQDFGQQLIAACASDDQTVGEDRMNIIAPLTAMYQRWVNDQTKPTSQHVGTVGDKLTVKVIMERSNTFEGTYGMTTVYNMREEATGNAFAWFSSKDVGMEKGNAYRVTGRIKKHDADKYRNGEAVTVLTRCKVEAA